MRHRRGGGGRVGGGSIGHFCWFFHHRILSVRLYIIDVSPQSLRRFRSFQSFQWLLRMTPSLLSLRRQINHFSFFIFPLFHSILLLLALPSGQHSPETLKKEPQIIYGRYVNVDYHPKSFISERCGANVNEFFTTTQPKQKKIAIIIIIIIITIKRKPPNPTFGYEMKIEPSSKCHNMAAMSPQSKY